MSAVHRRVAVSAVILIIAMTVMIFCNSAVPIGRSLEQSGKVASWMSPVALLFGISEDSGMFMTVVRKCAHFVEYMLLGGLYELLYFGMRGRLRTGFVFAELAILMTAVLDESFQLIVPGRTGRITDILIDLAGAFTGMLLSALIIKGVRHIRSGRTADLKTDRATNKDGSGIDEKN